MWGSPAVVKLMSQPTSVFLRVGTVHIKKKSEWVRDTDSAHPSIPRNKTGSVPWSRSGSRTVRPGCELFPSSLCSPRVVPLRCCICRCQCCWMSESVKPELGCICSSYNSHEHSSDHALRGGGGSRQSPVWLNSVVFVLLFLWSAAIVKVHFSKIEIGYSKQD